MKRLVLVLLTLLVVAPRASAQDRDSNLAPVAFLAGEFTGTGKHVYGAYDETMESSWALGGSILELRSTSRMGEQTVFEDLRVFSWDPATKAIRMRQWSRGLLREYSGSARDDGSLVFEETAREGAAPDAWRYTYEPGDGGFSYRVESKTGADWKPYVSGTLTQTLQDPSKGGGLGMREYETTVDGMAVQIHHPDGEGPFPAIVFSPGGGASTVQGYRPYGRWYATWGYVTVIVAFDDASDEERAPKFTRVADWLVAENARDGSPLKGLIDTERLAAAGHSRGGAAAIRAAGVDARFRACMAFAPAGPEAAVEGEGKAKTCVIAAGDDDLLPASRKAYETAPGERTLIVVAGMDHMLGPREQTLTLVERSTSFLRWALSGDDRYRTSLLAEREGLEIQHAD